ncbi:unnamed protein product, partial [Closterium sp. NIES-54]
PLGAVSTMAGPEERGGRVAGGSGEAQAQGQPRDSAMAPMQPSLGPPRDEPRVFGLDKFNGDNFAEWSFKMENIFDHYDLLEVMEGTEKRPENDPEKSPWVRKSAQGYLLLGQALGSSQIRHIKPFQREPEKGPKAWAALKGVHAPATAAVAVVLERQMAALRIEEDEAVEEGKTKLLALLPESWSSIIINLNHDLPHLSLEDVKRAILQEDFRRRELTSADGAGAASIGHGFGRGRGRGRGGGRFGGSNFNGGHGSSGYGNDNKNNGRGRGRFDGECHFCHKSGHMWRDCYKIPDGGTPAQGQEGRGAGGGRGRGRGGCGGRGGGAASMKSIGNESESRDDRFPGQFFFVSTQAPAGLENDESFEEPAAVGKVTLHSLDYWVIDSGATYSMTPRADLLTELEPSPVKHVTSALGQRAEVKGMGKAMFKGADGKMVGLKNVLWVPNLAANLISVRRLQKAGMDTSTKRAKTYTARLGERIIWDLHKDRDVYNEMWQIPVVPMPKERQVAASISTKGEAVGSGDGANGRAKEMKSKKCNLGGTSKLGEHEESGAAAQKQHKGEENPKAAAEEEYGENMWGTIASAAFSNPTSATGECDWLTLHRRMGHVALPILQQLVKNKMVAGIRVKGEPDEVLGCPTFMQAKFTRYSFSSSEATAKAPLDEVVMDVVGPLKLGSAGAEYFLTIVDVYTRMIWVYVLSKKSDVAETVKTDWLPMVERQQDWLVKAIRTDRGGEFLSKEFGLWLKKNGIRHFLTMPYSPAVESELKSIEENGVWELVELPEGRNAITSKGLFKIKSDTDGKIERYKSRLVAKGYQQKEKVEYKELFAPVVKPMTLRTLLAGATIKGWVVKQMDVTTAFLNGVIEEEIFMAQPEGFDDGSGRVLRLKKALYGVKQAPRQCYLKLRGVLEEIGFTPSTVDHSLFMLGEGEQRSFMVVYVADILIFSPSSDLMKEVMQKLQDKFKCKALGDVSFYLGLHIERDVEKRCMRVHQRKYLEALAANFGHSGGHAATPFPSGFKCVKGPEEESVDGEERRRFHLLVGSLMYAVVNTRPDVAFATGQLARVVQCPNEEQVAAGMRVAKYLGQTATVGLQYSAAAQRHQKGADGVEPGRLFLTAFSDASYASEPEDMTSVGGFICCVGGGPTAWESKKQVDQALSSMETEYMALFRAVREIVWQQRLLVKLGEEQQGPTPLYCDSQGAISLAKNPVLHGLTKHMRTFSPTPKTTALRVLLYVATQHDYELHSLDFSTAFLQGSLHEEIWLRRPPGFTGSFPAGTQLSLRRPVYGLRQAPHEWHDTLRTTLAALGFAPSSADPSLFLRTDTTLPPFYVLVAQRTITLTQRFSFTYSSPLSTPLPTGHSLSAPPSDESVELSGPYRELVGCLMHQKVHWDAAKRVLRYLCSSSGMGLVLGGRARVVLTGLPARLLFSAPEVEIYAGAMAAQKLRWLTYLLTDLGEAPRSPPVLYVDNKAMLAFSSDLLFSPVVPPSAPPFVPPPVPPLVPPPAPPLVPPPAPPLVPPPAPPLVPPPPPPLVPPSVPPLVPPPAPPLVPPPTHSDAPLHPHHSPRTHSHCTTSPSFPPHMLLAPLTNPLSPLPLPQLSPLLPHFRLTSLPLIHPIPFLPPPLASMSLPPLVQHGLSRTTRNLQELRAASALPHQPRACWNPPPSTLTPPWPHTRSLSRMSMPLLAKEYVLQLIFLTDPVPATLIPHPFPFPTHSPFWPPSHPQVPPSSGQAVRAVLPHGPCVPRIPSPRFPTPPLPTLTPPAGSSLYWPSSMCCACSSSRNLCPPHLSSTASPPVPPHSPPVLSPILSAPRSPTGPCPR